MCTRVCVCVHARGGRSCTYGSFAPLYIPPSPLTLLPLPRRTPPPAPPPTSTGRPRVARQPALSPEDPCAARVRSKPGLPVGSAGVGAWADRKRGRGRANIPPAAPLAGGATLAGWRRRRRAQAGAEGASRAARRRPGTLPFRPSAALDGATRRRPVPQGGCDPARRPRPAGGLDGSGGGGGGEGEGAGRGRRPGRPFTSFLAFLFFFFLFV